MHAELSLSSSAYVRMARTAALEEEASRSPAVLGGGGRRVAALFCDGGEEEELLSPLGLGENVFWLTEGPKSAPPRSLRLDSNWISLTEDSKYISFCFLRWNGGIYRRGSFELQGPN